MKKTIALALSIVLVLVSLSCIALAEEAPKFVTIQEWMDAKGECGNCMLVVKVMQELNPTVALVADETGTANLFSGINEGFNTGFDIAYSGTCGACFEALFNGIPAIAFSNENCRNYSAVRAHMAELTEELLQKEIERNAFWNINFPACDAGELKGIEYDRRPAEMQLYADNIPQKHYPDGRRTVMEWGVPVGPDEAPEGTDIHAV